MRKIFMMFLVVFCTSTAWAGDLCSPFTPEDARLDLYPFVDRPMTTQEQADLRLRSWRLQAPITQLNWHADKNACGGGRWVTTVIPTGKLVWIGDDGYVAYLDSCWNRLAPVKVVYEVTTSPETIVVETPKPKLRWLWQKLVDLGNWFTYTTPEKE